MDDDLLYNEDYDKALQQQVILTAFVKLEAVRTTWIVIGILQLILGGISMCDMLVGIPVFIMGAISLVHAHGISEHLKEYRRTPRRMYVYYKNNTTGMVISIIFNLLLGGIIGIIPPIRELMFGSYVKAHEYDLGR